MSSSVHKIHESTINSLAILSLIVLTLQNAIQVLLIRYTRTRPKVEMFYSTTAVFFTEIMKLLTCVIIVSMQERSFSKCLRMMYDQIVNQPMDTLKVCVPSMIYTVQNNLLYMAVSNLPAATFMVSYQLKILTTALFSVAMLGKPLSRMQWLALVILFAGVSVVQLQENGGGGGGGGSAGTEAPIPQTAFKNISQAVDAAKRASKSLVTPASPAGIAATRVQSPLIGFGCVITACMLSGFAGIYFEKILKGAAEVSVWMRNIQLAVLSIPISYVTMKVKDGPGVEANGLTYGYDAVVWTVVVIYAVGGLTVANVIKYADNILKGFATSIAIVVACVASMHLFNFQPSLQFLSGTVLVMLATYLYSKYPYTKKAASSLSSSSSPNGSSIKSTSLLLS